MKEEIRIARDWVVQYCFENPDASVDQIARDAKRCHKAIHKTEIAVLRRDVRLKIQASHEKPVQQYAGRAMTAAKGPIIHKKWEQPAKKTPAAKEPFNPPRIRLDQNDPERDVTVAEVEKRVPTATEVPAAPLITTETPVTETPPAPHATTAIAPVDPREKWLFDYCEAHPLETPQAVNVAAKVAFGSGFWMPKVSAALRFAKQYHGIPTEPVKPPRKLLGGATRTHVMRSGAEVLQLQKQRTQKDSDLHMRHLENAAKELARQMKLTSTRECTVSIDDEGGVDFKFERVEVTTSGKKLNLD
jgi:hypothetical protein